MAASTHKTANVTMTAAERVEKLVEVRLAERGTRRTFLKMLGVGAGVAAATSGCGSSAPTTEEFFRQHYTKLTPEDKTRIFARIEEETFARTGVRTHVSDPPPNRRSRVCVRPQPLGVQRKPALRGGLRRENNLPDDPEIRYIRVMEMESGSLDFEDSTADYDHDKVPAKGKFYLPVQCHQCDNPPCVKACPVGATWKEPDGIVVIDYSWCIGCRFCIVACPYFARRFNFSAPEVSPEKINPNQGYLSNRPRFKGVVEKCTFCLHRTRVGRMPACLEACPTGARKFGNLNDPKSEIRQIIESKRVFVLKEDLATLPRFYYFFA